MCRRASATTARTEFAGANAAMQVHEPVGGVNAFRSAQPVSGGGNTALAPLPVTPMGFCNSSGSNGGDVACGTDSAPLTVYLDVITGSRPLRRCLMTSVA